MDAVEELVFCARRRVVEATKGRGFKSADPDQVPPVATRIDGGKILTMQETSTVQRPGKPTAVKCFLAMVTSFLGLLTPPL